MRSTTTGWLLLFPTLLILFVVGVLPFLYVLVVGFFDWNVFAADPGLHFAGVENYRRLVFDPAFLYSIWITLQFAFFVVVSELILGYLLAQLLMRDFPGKGFFRTMHTLPLMVAPIAVGATWRLLTVPGLGPIPYYLDRWFDIDLRLGMFADQAFLTTVVMDIWHWTPLVTLTMLAGLAGLPKEPFEQAQVDGANRFQIFWHITLPMLRPVILATVFIRLMDAMRTVDEVWMLTGGGPGTATESPSIFAYKLVFEYWKVGEASALAALVWISFFLFCSVFYHVARTRLNAF